MHTEMFASAICHSSLRVLSLSTNRQLSDTFAAAFLPRLVPCALRALQLSDIGLTRKSRRGVANFVKNCRMQSLKLNANSLGGSGLQMIISALESNYWLTNLELHANRLMDESSSSSSCSDDTEHVLESKARSRRSNPLDLRALESSLKVCSIRNEHFHRNTHQEAVRLLHYARPILIESWWQVQHPNSVPLQQVLYAGGPLLWCVSVVSRRS
jgi:hypothetical protein